MGGRLGEGEPSWSSFCLVSLQLSAANTQDSPHVLSYSAVVPLLLAPPPADVFARMFLYLGFSGASLSSVLFLLFSLQNCCARHSSLTISLACVLIRSESAPFLHYPLATRNPFVIL